MLVITVITTIMITRMALMPDITTTQSGASRSHFS